MQEVGSGGIFQGFAKRRLWMSALLASVAAAGLNTPTHAQVQEANVQAPRKFDIAAQSLVDALADFGRQSGLQVSMDADQVRGISAPAVRGTMSASQALNRLLASTGFAARIDGRIVSLRRIAVSVADQGQGETVVLGPLRVEGTGDVAVAAQETGAQRDERRKDEIYDRDVSSTFASREEVERSAPTRRTCSRAWLTCSAATRAMAARSIPAFAGFRGQDGSRSSSMAPSRR
ncbi:STN domain-containing protein [Novosphingobium resinovorum]|uniref:STN domain-containing protein n=1 Tax=Novosphingobium TaxID=165696 RepID=UPI0020043917|nr:MULTISPECIES: STN domain-containing protein [Novosphingobium]WJM25185.1 STN domain-containing protein [Novosphingobium resinovorum]